MNDSSDESELEAETADAENKEMTLLSLPEEDGDEEDKKKKDEEDKEKKDGDKKKEEDGSNNTIWWLSGGIGVILIIGVGIKVLHASRAEGGQKEETKKLFKSTIKSSKKQQKVEAKETLV